MAGKKSGLQFALHRPNATRALVPAHLERLLAIAATAMTVLGQFGRASGNFMQDAASSCNRASQPFNEHPWRMIPHALAVLPLPCLVGNLFGDNGRAHGDDLMNKLAMQTFAMSGQLAFLVSQSTTGGFVALAVTPKLLPFLHPSFCIIVLRVIGPALPGQL